MLKFAIQEKGSLLETLEKRGKKKHNSLTSFVKFSILPS